MTSRLAASATENGRRRRAIVALSSSPALRRIAGCASTRTMVRKPSRILSVRTGLRRNLAYTGGMVDQESVLDALSNVIDPELGLDFVELGLIYGVEIDGGRVGITFTLTTPACPIGPQVSEQMEEFVSEIDGVEEVIPNMVFTPPWTPDKMSEDAKFALGY
jgi:metal-sulfur cluster biosynthetic enzyme